MAGNEQTFANWQGGYDPQGGETMPVLGPVPHFRDLKDRQLAAFGATPDTQHPDGYLGTQGASSRRQDKLLDGIHRQNHRSYSRGVHKGERVNQGDYFWPDEMTPMMGIERQMTGSPMKFTPPGLPPAPHLANDGKAGPRGVPRGLDRTQVEQIDAQRASMLKSLVPRYK